MAQAWHRYMRYGTDMAQVYEVWHRDHINGTGMNYI